VRVDDLLDRALEARERLESATERMNAVIQDFEDALVLGGYFTSGFVGFPTEADFPERFLRWCEVKNEWHLFVEPRTGREGDQRQLLKCSRSTRLEALRVLPELWEQLAAEQARRDKL